MARLSWKGSEILRNLYRHVILRNQQGPAATLIKSILKIMENTGVRLMEDIGATVSTSLSLVQYVYCVYKTSAYPFWTCNYLLFTQYVLYDTMIHYIMYKNVCFKITMFKMIRFTVNFVDLIKCTLLQNHGKCIREDEDIEQWAIVYAPCYQYAPYYVSRWLNFAI